LPCVLEEKRVVVHSDTFGIALGAVWLAPLIAATLWLSAIFFSGRLSAVSPIGRISLWGVFLTALIYRLIPSLLLNKGANYDIISYHTVGSLVLAGRDVYSSAASVGRYPYLPAQLFDSAASLALSRWVHIPLYVVIKMVPIVADACIATTIAAGLLRRSESAVMSKTAGLLYALNPIAVLSTAYIAQFDSVPLLGCVLAWYCLTRWGDEAPRLAVVLAGTALGAGIFVKSWPVLLLPAFFLAVRSRVHGLFLLSMAVLVPALGTGFYILLFHVRAQNVIHATSSYQSVLGWWGTGLFSREIVSHPRLVGHIDLWRFSRIFELLMIACIGAYVVWARRGQLTVNCATIFLVFYCLSAGFSVQYLMWVIPFFLVSGLVTALPYAVFTIASAVAIAINCFTDILYPHRMSLLPIPSLDLTVKAATFGVVYCILLWITIRSLLDAGGRGASPTTRT
jgi:hypothetical protein